MLSGMVVHTSSTYLPSPFYTYITLHYQVTETTPENVHLEYID